MKKYLLIIICLYFLFPHDYAKASNFQEYETNEVIVLYGIGFKKDAEKISVIYPHVKRHIEKIFGYPLKVKPAVVLVHKKEEFQKMAESNLTVAFANGEKNLIVLDYSRILAQPFDLETTLRHELFHIYIHFHIKTFIPRWFNEGLAQWVSNGIAEIIKDNKSTLNKAVISGSLISFHRLTYDFPKDSNGLILAYEQSQSFINFIVSQYDKQGLVRIFSSMKHGKTIEKAFFNELSITIRELEMRWKNSFKSSWAWLAFLSQRIYEILFLIMAILSIYAYIRLQFRKRSYPEEDDDEENEDDKDRGFMEYYVHD